MEEQLPRMLKYQTKGTQTVRISNQYHLYKIKSVWSPTKKRSKKITEKYLEAITADGPIKPEHERLMESLTNIFVKEFGATDLIFGMNKDIREKLRMIYPGRWKKELFVFAMFRLLYNTPIKKLQTHYITSFFSETLPSAHLSPKSVGNLLREIGREREKIKLFLSQFLFGDNFALIDLTHVSSLSEDVISSVPGYNTKREFPPQIRLIFIFSPNRHIPSYFRMVVGSILDMSSPVLIVREAGIRNAAVIEDKGLFSEDNIIEQEKEKLYKEIKSTYYLKCAELSN